jgi:hypothetical protein
VIGRAERVLGASASQTASSLPVGRIVNIAHVIALRGNPEGNEAHQ